MKTPETPPPLAAAEIRNLLQMLLISEYLYTADDHARVPLVFLQAWIAKLKLILLLVEGETP